MIIETERLVLRPFMEDDATDLYEYLKEPEVHCFECMRVTCMTQAIEEAIQRSLDGEHYFAVELKESGKVIGEIFAHAESTGSTDEELDTFSPCWMLHPEYKGKGYGYEAAYAYIDYLFQHCGARRVYMYTEDYNIASQKLCEKLGARQEGLFKEFVSFIHDENGDPVYENTYQYAILKKEWMQCDHF